MSSHPHPHDDHALEAPPEVDAKASAMDPLRQSAGTSSESGLLSRTVHSVAHVVPTLIVFGLLGLLGYWGHHWGWQLPKFSELTGAQRQDSDDWCVEHNVPETQCVQCGGGICAIGSTDSAGRVKDHGWCRVHGVHQCPHCNPEVAQVKEMPENDPQELVRVAYALQIRPRVENNSGCKQYQTGIQFASVEAVEKAGIDVEPALRQSMMETVKVNGEISYDQNKVAELAARVPGNIVWVEKQTGDVVRAGEVLALIDATQVGRAKAVIREAITKVVYEQANLERLRPLADKGAVRGTRILEVENELRDAKIQLAGAVQTLNNMGLKVNADELSRLSETEIAAQLQSLGVPESIRHKMKGFPATANLLPVIASIDGTIIDRHAVIGEVVDSTQVIFQLADISQMWLNFNIAIEDSLLAHVGQDILFIPDGTRQSYRGQISWISTSIDKTTRTLEARAELANPGGYLRDEMFGGGRLILREDDQAVVVPDEAIQRDGSCYIVFVRDKDYFTRENGPKLFYTRSVRIGVDSDGYTEIIAGVLPGEVVATVGSDVLRGQLLKANLGVG